jgi:hypothetical protein
MDQKKDARCGALELVNVDRVRAAYEQLQLLGPEYRQGRAAHCPKAARKAVKLIAHRAGQQPLHVQLHIPVES